MSAAVTVTTRADFRPGMVVENRQRFVVTSKRYDDGRYKLLHERDELVIVRNRWRVQRVPGNAFFNIGPYWVAKQQADDITDYEDLPWAIFDTFAEAIAYADRMARTEQQQGDDQ